MPQHSSSAVVPAGAQRRPMVLAIAALVAALGSVMAVPRDGVEAASVTIGRMDNERHDRAGECARGTTATVSVTVRSSTTRRGLVDLEIYSPTGQGVPAVLGQPVVHQERESHVHRQVEHPRQPGPRALTRSGSACSARLEPVPALERLRRNVHGDVGAHDADHVDARRPRRRWRRPRARPRHHDDGGADHDDARPRRRQSADHEHVLDHHDDARRRRRAGADHDDHDDAADDHDDGSAGPPAQPPTRLNWVGLELLRDAASTCRG